MAAVRVALIGYGAVAGEHATVLADSTAAELVAVVGPRREAASRFAASHGNPPVFTGLDAALAETPLDAAIVASPTPLHLGQAQAAVRAGLHVLVEFPLVASPAQLDELFSSASQARRLVAVAHTSRFIWAFTRAKALLDAAVCGRCRCAAYTRLLRRPRGAGSGGTRQRWCDDVLIHHSGHALDLFQYWFGREVEPVGVVTSGPRSGRRNAALLLRGPEGLPISTALTYDASYDALRITLTMERGVIDIDGFARLRVDGEEEMTERPATGDEAYHRAIALQDNAFLEALRDGPSFPVSPGEIARFNGVLGRAVQLAES